MRISDWSSDVCSSDLIIRVVAVDIGERIVTGAAAFAVCRIEQIDGLPVMGAEARARIVILAFHIEDDDRASPGQQVWNDNADAFARAGRGFEDRKSTRLNSSH